MITIFYMIKSCHYHYLLENNLFDSDPLHECLPDVPYEIRQDIYSTMHKDRQIFYMMLIIR